MNNLFERTANLIGNDALKKLRESHVCVFGAGGVGSAVIEGLVRGGIGHITIVDSDIIDETNINRQLIALAGNIGCMKTDEAKKRILDINPDCIVEVKKIFFLPENSSEINFSDYNYVVDAVDTVAAKIEIIRCSKIVGVPVISSMGTGNKLNPALFKVSDISETSVCPLARVMRRELNKIGIKDVKVVFSEEKPVRVQSRIPASISFVPPVAGFFIAGEVIKDIINM